MFFVFPVLFTRKQNLKPEQNILNCFINFPAGIELVSESKDEEDKQDHNLTDGVQFAYTMPNKHENENVPTVSESSLSLQELQEQLNKMK